MLIIFNQKSCRLKGLKSNRRKKTILGCVGTTNVGGFDTEIAPVIQNCSIIFTDLSKVSLSDSSKSFNAVIINYSGSTNSKQAEILTLVPKAKDAQSSSLNSIELWTLDPANPNSNNLILLSDYLHTRPYGNSPKPASSYTTILAGNTKVITSRRGAIFVELGGKNKNCLGLIMPFFFVNYAKSETLDNVYSFVKQHLADAIETNLDVLNKTFPNTKFGSKLTSKLSNSAVNKLVEKFDICKCERLHSLPRASRKAGMLVFNNSESVAILAPQVFNGSYKASLDDATAWRTFNFTNASSLESLLASRVLSVCETLSKELISLNKTVDPIPPVWVQSLIKFLSLLFISDLARILAAYDNFQANSFIKAPQEVKAQLQQHQSLIATLKFIQENSLIRLQNLVDLSKSVKEGLQTRLQQIQSSVNTGELNPENMVLSLDNLTVINKALTDNRTKCVDMLSNNTGYVGGIVDAFLLAFLTENAILVNQPLIRLDTAFFKQDSELDSSEKALKCFQKGDWKDQLQNQNNLSSFSSWDFIVGEFIVSADTVTNLLVSLSVNYGKIITELQVYVVALTYQLKQSQDPVIQQNRVPIVEKLVGIYDTIIELIWCRSLVKNILQQLQSSGTSNLTELKKAYCFSKPLADKIKKTQQVASAVLSNLWDTGAIGSPNQINENYLKSCFGLTSLDLFYFGRQPKENQAYFARRLKVLYITANQQDGSSYLYLLLEKHNCNDTTQLLSLYNNFQINKTFESLFQMQQVDPIQTHPEYAYLATLVDLKGSLFAQLVHKKDQTLPYSVRVTLQFTKKDGSDFLVKIQELIKRVFGGQVVGTMRNASRGTGSDVNDYVIASLDHVQTLVSALSPCFKVKSKHADLVLKILSRYKILKEKNVKNIKDYLEICELVDELATLNKNPKGRQNTTNTVRNWFTQQGISLDGTLQSKKGIKKKKAN